MNLTNKRRMINMRLKETYRELINKGINLYSTHTLTDNPLDDVRHAVVERLKNRLLDVSLQTEGVGAYNFIKNLHTILETETRKELVEALVHYHKEEKEFVRLARHRKDKEIQPAEIYDELLEEFEEVSY